MNPNQYNTCFKNVDRLYDLPLSYTSCQMNKRFVISGLSRLLLTPSSDRRRINSNLPNSRIMPECQLVKNASFSAINFSGSYPRAFALLSASLRSFILSSSNSRHEVLAKALPIFDFIFFLPWIKKLYIFLSIFLKKKNSSDLIWSQEKNG